MRAAARREPWCRAVRTRLAGDHLPRGLAVHELRRAADVRLGVPVRDEQLAAADLRRGTPTGIHQRPRVRRHGPRDTPTHREAFKAARAARRRRLQRVAAASRAAAGRRAERLVLARRRRADTDQLQLLREHRVDLLRARFGARDTRRHFPADRVHHRLVGADQGLYRGGPHRLHFRAEELHFRFGGFAHLLEVVADLFLRALRFISDLRELRRPPFEILVLPELFRFLLDFRQLLRREPVEFRPVLFEPRREVPEIFLRVVAEHRAERCADFPESRSPKPWLSASLDSAIHPRNSPAMPFPCVGRP